MDCFHLAQEELERLGRTATKGAPDTFDVFGFVDLLRRLVRADEPIVHAPTLNRDLEEPIACSVPTHPSVPRVITEGNHLLLDMPGCPGSPGMLHECWYVDPGERSRVERLVTRHVVHGRSPQRDRERSLGSDQANADHFATTGGAATRVVNPRYAQLARSHSLLKAAPTPRRREAGRPSAVLPLPATTWKTAAGPVAVGMAMAARQLRAVAAPEAVLAPTNKPCRSPLVPGRDGIWTLR